MNCGRVKIFVKGPSTPGSACRARRSFAQGQNRSRRPIEVSRQRLLVAALTKGDDQQSDGGFRHPGVELATRFSSFVNQEGLENPLAGRRPTPFMPPTTVVAVQLEALQRNDWPDTDAGARTAFAFAKPRDCEEFMPGQVRAAPDEAHSWGGRETWVSWDQFLETLRLPPYDVLLAADSWQPASPMIFPRTRKGTTALQAVKVRASCRENPNPDVQAPGVEPGSPSLREYTFTFCLERILVGPYKDCWLTAGVRMGDYANV